jgi:phosphoglycolate phosphatase-like HAD superfamily hydrolase
VTARPLAVVDIDGVLADVRHRLHHVAGRRRDWDAFFAAAPADPPHPEGMALLASLREDHDVVLLTGRPERCRADTVAWLATHDLGDLPLLMRPADDRRPAADLKVLRLRRLAQDRQVALVVDDDARVVAAARRAGFPVRHATWESRSDEAQLALFTAQEVDGRA